MSRESTSGTSGFIDPDEAPPVRQEDIDRAVFRIGRKSVQRKKVRVDMLLDDAILRYFKNRAGSRRYQDLINEALGEYVRAHP